MDTSSETKGKETTIEIEKGKIENNMMGAYRSTASLPSSSSKGVAKSGGKLNQVLKDW